MGIKNKRAMFFTLIAIALLTLSLASFSIMSIKKEREAIKNRIETMNNYVHSFEKDLPRKIYITGFRIIFLYEKRMLETGEFIINASDAFEEAFFNGTINGNITSSEQSLIQGVRFEDIFNDINEDARKINVNVSFENPKINITQIDPWNLYITFKSGVFIQDRGNLASWNRTEVLNVKVPISNFEDPLYIINTNGKITHKINETPYESFTSGTNVTNLTNHVENFYYKESSEAPSFLMRIEGNTSESTYGIESLVHIPTLSAKGVAIKDKSVVDHIYFGLENPSTKNIQGMSSWFKLDDNHLDDYDVSGLAI